MLNVVLLFKGELGENSRAGQGVALENLSLLGSSGSSPQKCFISDPQDLLGPSQRLLSGDHSGYSTVVSHGLVAHGLSCIVPEVPQLSCWNSDSFL